MLTARVNESPGEQQPTNQEKGKIFQRRDSRSLAIGLFRCLDGILRMASCMEFRVYAAVLDRGPALKAELPNCLSI